MLFSDVTFSTEALVVIGTMIIALTGAVSLLYKQVIASKNEQIMAMESRAKSYEEMSDEAITHLEKAASSHMTGNGKPKPALVASIVPEHNSPVTIKQQATADLQTMRARLVAATLQLDLPPRESAPPADKDPT